jgi:hypothetical protein
MTSIPHLGGTEGDQISAQYVYNKFSEQKLDYFKMIDYDVLLDYPDPDKPNKYKNFKKYFSNIKY